MKKGKRLSKADALRVLRRAYDLIKNDNYTFMCRAIEKAAVELSLAERSCVACYLIPELKMFKPVNRKKWRFSVSFIKEKHKVTYNRYANRYI